MTDLDNFKHSLSKPDYRFEQTLEFISRHYDYTPTAFLNGTLSNIAGQNEGSCKLLGLAQLEGLSLQITLQAFGEHYQSVLNNPQGHDHGNIRALMVSGLNGVRFESTPLTRKV